MTAWTSWNRAEHPEHLADYVQTDVTRLLLPGPLAQRLPGPGSHQTRAGKAEAIYAVLADAGIRYRPEPATSTQGGQVVRPPDQVLARPKHATCVDLAVVYAGACLDAGLHPLLLVVDSATEEVSHALVAVWLGGDWALNTWHESLFGAEVVPEPPILDSGLPFARAIRQQVDAAGEFLVIDVAGAARDGQTEAVSFRDAVLRGYEIMAATQDPGGRWRWGVAVDVGEARRQRPGFDLPEWLPTSQGALIDPYPVLKGELSPLGQLKARTGRVPFQDREELDILMDWADPVTLPGEQHGRDVSQTPSWRVLQGVGGSGKTHLAAELCRRLAGRGWYAGFVAKPVPTQGVLDWIGGVVSPLLAVVDYADDVPTPALVGLLKTLAAREQPTRVLFTARTEGDWHKQLMNGLNREGVGMRNDPVIALERRHSNARALFARTYDRFVTNHHRERVHFTQLARRDWTTLDVVLQAWLAATSMPGGDLPKTREELYDEVLDREFGYWQHVIDGRLRPPPDPQPAQYSTPAVLADEGGSKDPPPSLVPVPRLAQAGAAVTLVAPRPDELLEVLRRLPQPEPGEPSWGQISQSLIDLLDESGGDGGVAVRPDPVGEYLVQRECKKLSALVDMALPQPVAPPAEPVTRLRQAQYERDSASVDRQLGRAVETVTRSAQIDRATAAALAEECLTVRPGIWPQAVAHAMLQGGVFAGALEVVARQPNTPLPLAELSAAVPLGHGALRGLALAAVQSQKPTLPEEPAEADLARLAGWLNNLAVRYGEVGDRAGALAAIDEAVTIRRGLAEQNPAAFTPDLAGSLNNQANRRSEVGDRAGALAAIDEAVSLYRGLAEQNPAAFTPDLAGSLNNQAAQRSEVGDRAGALAAIDEAVTLYRGLAEQNPAAFTPNLAMSLNNQANRRSEVGDRAGALAAIDEAVTIRRGLAEQNPAAFTPDLAMSLNNQANRRSEVGDRAGALAAIDEAVSLYRGLAEQNPAAFTPDLAGSLNNQAAQRSEVGDRAGALAAIDEAVTLYRGLAEQNPAAFTPNLAMSLNNQAAMRSEVGDRAGALAAIDEAVTIRRGLAEQNPAAFTPDLAMSLNNQAAQRSEVGDRAGALAAIDEAVNLYRGLAEQNPAAFTPDLAMSLNNQAAMRSEVGDRAGALAAIDEAVNLYRGLAELNPAAFTPDLAASLNNQAAQRSEVGDRAGALAAFADAWEGLCPSSQAQLRVARIRWLLSGQAVDAEADGLLIADHAAAAELAAEDGEARLVGPARRAVVGVVEEARLRRPDLGAQINAILPGWALAQPDEDLIGLGNDWLNQASWSEREQFLRAHLALLQDPSTRSGLARLRFQQPEISGLTLLEHLLTRIDEHGADQALATARHGFTLVEELTAWLRTATWQGSEEYLAKHRHLLNEEDAPRVLAGFGPSPMIQQHLGLLILAAATSIDLAYAARADVATATALANELIERYDWQALQALALASPGLAERPFTLLLIHLVLDAIRAVGEWTPDPDTLELAHRHGTAEQRRAAAGRLTRLTRDHPNQSRHLTTLAAALTPNLDLDDVARGQ